VSEDRAPARGRPVDWDEARLQLKKLEASLAERWEPGPAQKKSILRQRALALAEEEHVRETGERLQVVEFLIGRERYAIETAHAVEVVPLRDLATLPFAPAYVLGVTNVRGRIVVIVDLRRFLDLPSQGLAESARLLLVEHGGTEIGVLCDAVPGVREVRADGLQPPVATMKGASVRYLRGITGDSMAVLDAERILADVRANVKEEMPP